jgi:hypothetical protein
MSPNKWNIFTDDSYYYMTGKTLYVSRPDTKLARLLDKGVIDKKEFEKKLNDFGPGGRLEFVQMEITADLEK